MLTAQDNKDQLPKLIEAMSVGYYAGQQGEDPELRPSDTRVFYGTPVVVAITVGLNGYIVDMNWQSWKEYEQITKVQKELCKR
jgi:hypothetical protein